MSSEEIQQIVANGEREVGFTFEPSATELVVAVSRGSPYVANLLCHHAGQECLGDGRVIVATADVALAVDRVQDEFQSQLSKPVASRLRAMIDKGYGADLDIAARTMLSAESAIGVIELRAHNDLDEAQAEAILKHLVAGEILVLADEVEPLPRYEFIEEGLATYLWVTSTQANLRPDHAKARVTRR